jgi:hypothetical protein
MAETSSRIVCKKCYEPGVVAQVVLVDVVGRVRESKTDDSGIGRYVAHEIQGRKGTTAHRARNASETGPETAYTQQVAVMRTDGMQTPNPRWHVLVDLKRSLKCTSRGARVCFCVLMRMRTRWDHGVR